MHLAHLEIIFNYPLTIICLCGIIRITKTEETDMANTITTRKRFSKTALLERLYNQKNHYENLWGFLPTQGWAQVAHQDKEANRAYGEYDAITSLIEDLEGWV